MVDDRQVDGQTNGMTGGWMDGHIVAFKVDWGWIFEWILD